MIEHNHEQWPHCTTSCAKEACLEGCQASACPGVHRMEAADGGGMMLAPDFDERPWFEARLSFEAISKADAEFLVDRIAETVCRGHGQGDDHICKFQFVISGPVEISMADEDG